VLISKIVAGGDIEIVVGETAKVEIFG